MFTHLHSNNNNNDGKSKQPRKTIWWKRIFPPFILKVLRQTGEGETQKGDAAKHAAFSRFSSSDAMIVVYLPLTRCMLSFVL
jgi:hypothetical protein